MHEKQDVQDLSPSTGGKFSFEIFIVNIANFNENFTLRLINYMLYYYFKRKTWNKKKLSPWLTATKGATLVK